MNSTKLPKIGDLVIVLDQGDSNEIINVGFVLKKKASKFKILWIIDKSWANEFYPDDFYSLSEDFKYYFQTTI